MSDLQFYLSLVHKKNELNRKRRRFYYYMSPTSWYAKHTPFGTSGMPYSKAEAKHGYKQAQQEMKAMTQDMRELRVALRIQNVWSNHGAIREVIAGGQRYGYKDFERAAWAENMEVAIFGEVYCSES